MSPFAVRLGAGAGWLAFIGVVVGLILIPTVVAGQPPTPSTALSAVSAYYAHPELAAVLGLLSGFIAVAFIVFGLGLRAAMMSAAGDRDRAFADVGMGLLVVAMTLNLVSGALGATLVDVAGRGAGELATIFRLHEVLFDGLADVLEGAWIGAFSLAMLGGAMPRWIGWLGVGLGLSRWVKALAPFVALPDPLAMASNLVLIAWLLATVVALTRSARRSGVAPSPSAAPAWFRGLRGGAHGGSPHQASFVRAITLRAAPEAVPRGGLRDGRVQNRRLSHLAREDRGCMCEF